MKQLVIILAILSGMFINLHGQAQETRKEPPITAEIRKMVELNDSQIETLNNLYIDYAARMDYAINKEQDKKETADLIYRAKKDFNTKFMNILSDKQKVEYVRNSSYPEIMEKTEIKVNVLRKTRKYTDKELEKATSDIFEYLMLEQNAYIQTQYNIEIQEENLARLKKYEPESLRTANIMQEAKHEGIAYQNGYQW